MPGREMARGDVGRLGAGDPSFAVSLDAESEDAAHHASEAVPVGGVLRKLLAAAFGYGIELSLAIVVRDAPFRGNPAFLLEPDQRSINCALIEQHSVAANLLDATCDAIAVERA